MLTVCVHFALGVWQSALSPHSALRVRATPAMAMATRVDDALVSEALRALLGSDDGCTVTPTSGGVNNMVQYVDTPSGERLVLRIYNNGGNTARVRYEHAVLDALPALGPFSFQLPTYRRAPNGETSVLLSNGASACISQLIPGGLPKTADPEPIGRATGELLMALGKVRLPADVTCVTPPYFDVWNVHKGVGGNRQVFYDFVAGSELDTCRGAMDRLIAQFKELDARLALMAEQKLPIQLVHGDLHYDNVLFDTASGAVSGLLDFEFAAVDWRAMELAVCLSKYVGEPDPFPLCRAFIAGFCNPQPTECEGLAEMINLRIMSNVVYFVGRAISGEDTIDSLTTRADMYATRMEWVSANRQRIVDCIVQLLQERDPSFA
ncbi:hypothetical protein KFE25_009658 [Diacronema lutheri]|uniref:Aminoglycoside phosphotransferase domain-containing protein n=1 Tax=Diacronema lutheri TaxID=2081491 RepID=A0A8J5XYM3_DIALT|nr:hypothetical protein KFE25_009658 [Diacronema lutheri]